MTSIDETQRDSADGYRSNTRDDSVDLGITKHLNQKPPVTRKQWLLVLSAFVVFLNTWGLLLTFGAFQTYYEKVLLPERSSSEITWISTVCGFILLFSGMITGTLFDYGYLRPMLLMGSILQVFGLMMVSISTQYYQLFLAQGICVGLGAGMLYIPCIAAAAASLQEYRRAKFMGLIASGTGIGGVIYPVIFQRLVPSLGFPWAVRVIAFVMLSTYMASYPSLLYKPEKKILVRSLIDVKSFSDLPFLLIVSSGFFCAVAYYLPSLYLPLFAETKVIGFQGRNTDLATYLISIVNGASVIGRLAAGAIATVIGPTETSALAIACSALIAFMWIVVKSKAGTIVWAVFWGLASSVIVAMPGAVVPLFCPSMDIIGTRMGMFWAGVGAGLLVGSPAAGALIDVRAENIAWWRLQIFTGVFMTAGALSFVYPVIHVRRRRQVVTRLQD